jgi:hypothetical protein
MLPICPQIPKVTGSRGCTFPVPSRTAYLPQVSGTHLEIRNRLPDCLEGEGLNLVGRHLETEIRAGERTGETRKGNQGRTAPRLFPVYKKSGMPLRTMGLNTLNAPTNPAGGCWRRLSGARALAGIDGIAHPLQEGAIQIPHTPAGWSSTAAQQTSFRAFHYPTRYPDTLTSASTLQKCAPLRRLSISVYVIGDHGILAILLGK